MAEPSNTQPATGGPTIRPEDIHMPPSSYWPIVLALGITIILFGFAASFPFVIFGVLLSLIAAIGWVTEPGYEPIEHEHH